MTGAFGNNSSCNIGAGRGGGWLQTDCILGDSKTENAARTIHIERFSLDCRKTKTKVNTLANQRA